MGRLILENEIETYLKSRVEYLGGKCIKFYSASETGIPDRIVILPENRVAFVELKRPTGGKASPLQKYQMDKLTKLGCMVRVVKTYKEVEMLLDDMQKEDAGK